MKRLLVALLIGSVFVGLVSALGREQVATPVPFWLLLPGIVVGACAPDSHFDPEGNYQRQWGPISLVVLFAVNMAVYSGLAYLMLYVASLRPENHSTEEGGPGRTGHLD